MYALQQQLETRGGAKAFLSIMYICGAVVVGSGDGMLFAIDLCCQHFNYWVCKYAQLHYN